MLAHNFGHFRASLLNVFGTMSEQVAHDLQLKDRESTRSASGVHTLNATSNVAGRRKHRAKRASGSYAYGNDDK